VRLFELLIQRDFVKLDDGKLYETPNRCCTFNTRRKNATQNLTGIQLAPCSNNNLLEDWRSYGFYVKVDMSKVPNYTGLVYPFYSPIAPVAVASTATFNRRVCSFKSAENGFYLAKTILGGRDVIEEYVAVHI
jgi:hypothetical protein